MVEIKAGTFAYIALGILLSFGAFMIFIGSLVSNTNESLVSNGWNLIWISVILIIIKMIFDFTITKYK